MTDVQNFDAVYVGLKEDLQGAEASRAKASRTKTIRLAVGLAATVVLTLLLFQSGIWYYVAGIGLIGSFWWAYRPMNKVAAQIKLPVLRESAKQLGLTYQPSGFSPPGSAQAHNVLFQYANTRAYNDCFTGLRNGRPIAFYEADLSRNISAGENDSSKQIFKGQIYTFQRGAPVVGEIVIVPDRGLFKVFKPAKTLQLVKFQDDPEFAKRFNVYATQEDATRAMLTSELRKKLLEWRGNRPMFVHLEDEEAMVAISGNHLFQPNLNKKLPTEESARGLYNGVRTCLTQLDQLTTELG